MHFNYVFNQFTRLFRLFLRGQVTRHGFTLIGAPRRICVCPKFLLLLQCFSNPRFLPFLSDPSPVLLHLFRLYLYGSSMPVRVMISRFQQIPRRFGMHVIANQLPGILRGTNPSSDGRNPPSHYLEEARLALCLRSSRLFIQAGSLLHISPSWLSSSSLFPEVSVGDFRLPVTPGVSSLAESTGDWCQSARLLGLDSG